MLHNFEAKLGEACFVNFSLRFVRSRDGGVTRLAGIGFVIHQIGTKFGSCPVENRWKNLWSFSLFSSYYFPGLCCADFSVACFVLIFTSLVSFTGFYTEYEYIGWLRYDMCPVEGRCSIEWWPRKRKSKVRQDMSLLQNPVLLPTVLYLFSLTLPQGLFT